MTAAKTHKVVAVVQARMSSTRLPGKVLMPLGTQSLIAFMIARIRRSQLIDTLVVATSTHESDDPLAAEVSQLGVQVARGPLDDVLGRFLMVADRTEASIMIRLTGDCPLIDPGLIDEVAAKVIAGEASYASNCFPATFPDGLDCEAFTTEMLRAAAAHAHLPSEREHVTPWIRVAARTRSAVVIAPADLSAIRWTVDYADDLQTVQQIIAQLGPAAVEADLFDLLRAHHQLAIRAAQHARNEGYAKSLGADTAIGHAAISSGDQTL